MSDLSPTSNQQISFLNLNTNSVTIIQANFHKQNPDIAEKNSLSKKSEFN